MKDSGHSRLRKLLRAGRLIHQAAKTFGLTGERRRDIPKENPANRQKAIGEHSRRNREEDPAAAQARQYAAAQKEADTQRAREMLEDEETLTALSLRGYSIEKSGEEGRYRLYAEGTVDPKTGEFTRGEKSIEMTEDEIGRFAGSAMRADILRTIRSMKDATAGRRMLDAFRKRLKGKIHIHFLPSMETAEMCASRARLAKKRAEAAARKIMEEEPGAAKDEARKRALAETHQDIDKYLTLGEAIRLNEEISRRIARKKEEWTKTRAARIVRGKPGTPPEEARMQALAEWEDQGLRGVNAHVLTRNSGVNKERVLRIAIEAQAHQIAEELGRQILLDRLEQENMSLADAYRVLAELKETLAGHKDERVRRAAESLLPPGTRNEKPHEKTAAGKTAGSDLSGNEADEMRSEALETLSFLMMSDLMEDARDAQGDFPSWARELFRADETGTAEMPGEPETAYALAALRAAGQMNNAARNLLGAAPDAVERALRGRVIPPMPEEYRRDFLERGRKQAELDAEYGRGGLCAPQEPHRHAGDEKQRNRAERRMAARLNFGKNKPLIPPCAPRKQTIRLTRRHRPR
ncbi:MAG: hypothetical protein LUG84_05035 [Akkermansiaceae bacterium]|nr:hypothetical protein [Akkermansiaceae bacterium]